MSIGMEPRERNFQGIWIPRSIYLNNEVNWYAKILFMEIHSFTENGRECYMSNRYIASFNGRKRYLKSLLRFGFKIGDPAPTMVSGLPGHHCRGSMDKSVEYTKQVTKQGKKEFTFLKEGNKNRSPILE